MQIANYANLSSEKLAAIERELPEQRTLMEVVEWGLKRESGARLPAVVAEVLPQDEYTHDVIVPWREPLVLVYGTT